MLFSVYKKCQVCEKVYRTPTGARCLHREFEAFEAQILVLFGIHIVLYMSSLVRSTGSFWITLSSMFHCDDKLFKKWNIKYFFTYNYKLINGIVFIWLNEAN